MDHYMLISIIIPVYNVAPFLPEALDSVINQTYDNLEIIIIDDGSIDGSGRICDEYAQKDGRICVIHQNNRGLSAARNVGLSIMTGEAIAFLDADDAFQPDFIETMVDAFISEEPDIVICKFTIHRTSETMEQKDMDEVKPAMPQGIYDRGSSLRALVDGRINQSVWNKLYKRKLLENIRFPEGHVFEDLDTTYQIINACTKTLVLDKALYLCRKRHGSISHTYSQKNVEDLILASTHFETFVKANTPGVFSNKELIHARQATLNRMISYYLWLSANNKIGENAYREKLRKQIVEVGDTIGIGNCGLRRLLFYKMICICPGLLRIVYPFYYRIRRYPRNKANHCIL